MMLHARDFYFVGFLCRYALLVGLIFGAMSLLASLLFGGFAFRDVLIGVAIGFFVATIGAIGLLRSELSELMFALVKASGMAFVDRARLNYPDLDFSDPESSAALSRETLRIARQELRGRRFLTIDVESELSA